jgi:hypothetical protein
VFLYLHDDHKLHLEYHTNLAKSEEAQSWDDEKFKALDEHIMAHWFVVQGALSRGMESAEETRGTVPTAEPMVGKSPAPGPIPKGEGGIGQGGPPPIE